MAQNVVNIFQAKVINALDTYNHTALQNSMYKVSVNATEIPPSGLAIVIQQNSVTKATAALPAAAQNHVDLQVVLNCAVNDVISVILSSASNADKGINEIKAILNIHPGSV